MRKPLASSDRFRPTQHGAEIDPRGCGRRMAVLVSRRVCRVTEGPARLEFFRLFMLDYPLVRFEFFEPLVLFWREGDGKEG